jgi:hypothetical protein
MSKIKVYLRVAQQPTGRRHKILATLKPSYGPITDSHGDALPTVAFALSLDIDPAAFRTAERVLAELTLGADEVAVAAEIVKFDDDTGAPTNG